MHADQVMPPAHLREVHNLALGLQRSLYRLEHVFDNILNGNTIQELCNGLHRAAPLSTPFILWCRNDDSMWVDFTCRKGY
jgi:hypothetical protein